MLHSLQRQWAKRAEGAPAGAERGFGVPASDGDGGSGGAKPPGLKIVPQRKLHRARLVALRVDRAEGGCAPVRVRSTEKHAVEEIPDRRLEPQLPLVGHREHFEDVQIFAVVREIAHRIVSPDRVPELEWTGVRPGSRIEVAVGVRIEVSIRDHRLDTADPIRALLVIEEEAAKIVGHRDVDWPPALVSEHAADVPAPKESFRDT